MAFEPFRGIVAKTGPSLAVQEVLYGFIMALIFVTAARVGLVDHTDRWRLILLIIGMNLSWGAIDAIVFFLMDVFDQRRFVRIITNADGLDRGTRVSMLQDAFSGTPLDLLDPECERRVCEMMLDQKLENADEIRSDRKAMVDSSVACFIITALTIIPVILPIALIDDIMTGLALASVISSMVLMIVGLRMGRHIGLDGWKSGLLLTAFSWTITIVATFTGG